MLVLRPVSSHVPVTMLASQYVFWVMKPLLCVRRGQDARQDLDQQCDHLHVCCSCAPCSVTVAPSTWGQMTQNRWHSGAASNPQHTRSSEETTPQPFRTHIPALQQLFFYICLPFLISFLCCRSYCETRWQFPHGFLC